MGLGRLQRRAGMIAATDPARSARTIVAVPEQIGMAAVSTTHRPQATRHIEQWVTGLGVSAAAVAIVLSAFGDRSGRRACLGVAWLGVYRTCETTICRMQLKYDLTKSRRHQFAGRSRPGAAPAKGRRALRNRVAITRVRDYAPLEQRFSRVLAQTARACEQGG